MPRKRKELENRYYSDPLNDDFVHTKTNLDYKIDTNYEYLPKGKFKRFWADTFYYGIAVPLLWLEGKLFKGVKVHNKKYLKEIKKEGYVMYCNHTHARDAFLGQVFLANPKRTYIIASKDAVEVKGLRVLTKALGAFPVADTMQELIKLNKTVKQVINEKHALMIFPEAHIWPYYTSVREFPTTSFRFVSDNNCYCVPVATCYEKRWWLFPWFRKPRMHVYIGKPIKPDPNLNKKENAIMLHDYVYNYILETTKKYSTEKTYNYIYKPKDLNESH